jgi:ABC-2 type transport system permease protein
VTVTSSERTTQAGRGGLLVLPWWRQLDALGRLARARASAMFAYRSTMGLFLATSMVQIFMLKKVWQALYAVRPGMLPIPLDDLITYVTVANLIVWTFPTHSVMRTLRERIREGAVVFDLARPVGFMTQLVAQVVGEFEGSVVIITVALPVVAFAGSLALPAGAGACGLFLVSLMCAYAIAGLLAILLALIAFWTLETEGLGMLYTLVASFLSGALVPLDAFPTAVRVCLRFLPFSSTTSVPARIYIGNCSGAEAWRAIGLQVAWAVALSGLTALITRRAIRRVVVQGG